MGQLMNVAKCSAVHGPAVQPDLQFCLFCWAHSRIEFALGSVADEAELQTFAADWQRLAKWRDNTDRIAKLKWVVNLN